MIALATASDSHDLPSNGKIDHPAQILALESFLRDVMGADAAEVARV